jgi:hypothetical protein
MMWRAEITQTDIWLAFEAPSGSLRQSRFSNSRLARDQHDLAPASLCLRPSAAQQFNLLFTADEWRVPRAQCLKAAPCQALAQDTKGQNWRCQSLHLNFAQALVLEKIAD